MSLGPAALVESGLVRLWKNLERPPDINLNNPPPATASRMVLVNNFSNSTSVSNIVLVIDYAGSPPDKTRRTSIKEWIETCEALQALNNNWDGYGSPRPSTRSIERTKSLLNEIHKSCSARLSPTLIAASTEGGVGLSFVTRSRRGIVEIYNSGKILAAHSEIHGQPYVWPVRYSPADLRAALEKIDGFLSNTNS